MPPVIATVPELQPQPQSQSTTTITPTKSRSPKHEPELTDQTNLLPPKQVIIVFLSLSFVSLTVSLDSTIVATSLSTVSAVFNAGSVSSWVPSAYLLTSTAFQPLYGRFSDIFGRKNTFCFAMALFVIGNLIAGFSKSIIELIVFRGVAGAGGGGVISITQIIISDIVSLRERGKYIGIVGVFLAVGNCVGPIIGGALAQNVDWSWCFWITLPLAVVSTVVVLVLLPLKPVSGDIRRRLLIIDYFGSVLTLAACTLIMLPLIWGGITFPWSSATVIAPLISGFFVMILFCFWEWRGAKLPIVPMYIFKHMTVCGVYIVMFVNGFVFYSALYYIPQFFQVALDYSPTRAGIFLIPVLMGQTVSTLIAGLVVSHTGKYRAIVYCGFALSAIACGCISIFTETTSRATMVVLMLLAGIGNGATMQTTTVAAQASVPRKDMSVVTAFRNFIRMLGGAFALPVASALVNNALRTSLHKLNSDESTISLIIDDPTILSNSTAYTALGFSPSSASFILNRGYTIGFRDLFFLNAALAVLATVVTVVMIRHKELIRSDEAELRSKAKGIGGVKEKRDTEKGDNADEEQSKTVEGVQTGEGAGESVNNAV
ncbi:MFS general substrate transporter [Dendrothele bispora CBS 962.96]|uniref:MFS general substrate transporter n=1 Tax=Dendrothele bispora (strain CBS 962.96) TaxID=1314807 RepID=A0A4S8M5E7_DENBC|nr:MFS general substrate transporter [Dendrothele bispora CBS 962.96]